MAAEYRISGRRLRRTPDPEASADPAILAVLEQLRSIPAPPAPREQFRVELRAQLVAIAPRIIAESAADDAAAARTAAPVAAAVGVLDRPRPRPVPVSDEPRMPSGSGRRAQPRESFWHRLREIPIGRPLAVVASLVTVLALILGGAVWMSQDSLPGDTLYGLKRASEQFELSRTDSDTERAHKLLEFATTRVDEARQLVSRPSASAAGAGPLADGQLSAHTNSLVSETLASANDDTRTASRLLGGAAVAKASATPLAGISSWASEQLDRLTRLRESIPTDAEARSSATRSADLVQAFATRSAQLQSRVSCDCLSKVPSDSLGPVPSAVPSVPRPSTPAKTTPSAPSAPTGGSRSTSAPRTSGTTSGGGGAGSGSTSATSSTAPPPKQLLPSLVAPSNPVTTHKPLVDLCKVTLLGVRLCPTSTP